MSDKKPTTGPLSHKRYRCTGCKREVTQATNHWGETYGDCVVCVSEGNFDRVWECLEPVPEGYDVPAKWKRVRLGDTAEIG
jgi:hypothetical protein